MAERRMFAKTIIDSDAFLDMPMTAQCLYFHLAMRADDEGFLNNPKKVQRMVGASDDDLKLLLAKRFILAFESGVIVIKHWRIHNYIRSDRFKPTTYADEKAQLTIKSNGAYTEHKQSDLPPVEDGIPDDNHLVYQMDTQDRLGKVRIGKDRLGKDTLPRARAYEADDGFDSFWNAYPKKGGDIKACYMEYLHALDTGATPQTLLQAVEAQKREWAHTEKRYIPNPERWLENRGWTQETDAPPTQDVDIDELKRILERMGGPVEQ